MPSEEDSTDRASAYRQTWDQAEQLVRESRPPDSAETVDVGEGQRVPRRFQRTVMAEPDDIAADITVTVEMDATRPMWTHIDITRRAIPPDDPNEPSTYGPAIDPSDLTRIDWPAVFRSLVRVAALETAGYRVLMPGETETPGQSTHRRETWAKANRAAKRTTRRDAVTPAYLAQVVRLVEVDGLSVIQAAEKIGKSRSYVYRLLDRAREELSQ